MITASWGCGGSSESSRGERKSRWRASKHQSGLREHWIFKWMRGELPRAQNYNTSKYLRLCLAGIQLWLRTEGRAPLSTFCLLAYKRRQVFIVILCTFLEVIKYRLELQHLLKPTKEKKPLNVSLLLFFFFFPLFYFIFYKVLQGMKKKSEVKVKKWKRKVHHIWNKK